MAVYYYDGKYRHGNYAHYKGFHVQQCTGDSFYAKDMLNNSEYLNGRTNEMEKYCFRFASLASIKKAIDRYELTHPADPIFDEKRFRNSPVWEEIKY